MCEVLDTLLKREKNLLLAKSKVERKLAVFSRWSEIFFHRNYDNLPEEERQRLRNIMNSWNWNDWHDLDDRLKSRLIDNYMLSKDLEFETICWVSY